MLAGLPLGSTMAAVAVGAGYFAVKKIAEGPERVETAEYATSTALAAAEMRQDRSMGLRSDVSRHSSQALQQ